MNPQTLVRARDLRVGFTSPEGTVNAVNGVDLHLVAGSDPGTAIRRITDAVTPARIELARPRLEDIFISLVSDGSTPAPAPVPAGV